MERRADRMVDVALLVKEVDETMIPITKICEKAGMLRETYYNRLKNPEKFTASEIEGLSNACNWNASKRNQIFFAKNSE